MKHIIAKNILILKNRAMGDSIISLGAVQYLRELYPESNIYYGVPAWVEKLYKNTEIAANSIVPINLKKLKDYIALWKFLKKNKIELIYEMHQSGRTSKFFKIYSFFNRVPYFFHNHHLKSGGQVIDQGKIKAVIQRDLDGVYSYLGKDKPYPNYLNYTPEIKVQHIKENKIIFGVVATRQTKMWPLDFYIKLAKLIENFTPNTKIEIPLSQSSGDQIIQKTLEEQGLPSNIQIVHYPLDQLPNKISSAKLYIGNDTGLKHLAIATKVKSYTLFGPEPPQEWHPYNTQEHPYFYIDGLACRTASAHYCGLSQCDSMICLNQISPEKVFESIKSNL